LDRESQNPAEKRSGSSSGPERYHYVDRDRLQLQLGVSEELLQRLQQLQDFLSSKKKRHVKLEEVLDTISKEYVGRHDPIGKAKRRLDRLSRKHNDPKPVPKAKHIARDSAEEIWGEVARPGLGQAEPSQLDAELRREHMKVWRRNEVLHRDQGRCTYVHANGQRCGSQRWLHIHHIVSKLQGGGNPIDNLTTLCAMHHRLVHFHRGWREDQKSRRLYLDETLRQGQLAFRSG